MITTKEYQDAVDRIIKSENFTQESLRETIALFPPKKWEKAEFGKVFIPNAYLTFESLVIEDSLRKFPEMNLDPFLENGGYLSVECLLNTQLINYAVWKIGQPSQWEDYTLDYARALTILEMRDTVCPKSETVSYSDYYNTDWWKAIRAVVIERDGHCLLCRSKSDLRVHHNTYKRVGCELLGDLVTLCESCHSSHHGRGNGGEVNKLATQLIDTLEKLKKAV